MSQGGGGTNTVVQQQQPNPAFTTAYTNLTNQANNVAQQPLQTYGGNLVAPLAPDQTAAIQGIQGAQGVANPFINAAAQEIGNSTTPVAPSVAPYAANATSLLNQAGSTNLVGYAQPSVSQADSLYNSMPGIAAGSVGSSNQLYDDSAKEISPTQFSAGQVSQYESPYTQQVVNATQAEFNNQNRQQQASLTGNAISNGAFGGDRAGVAQGIAAGQEQLAQAPVIAGLENQGYSQALGEFNTQQQVGVGAQEASQQLQQGAAAGILQGNQALQNAYGQSAAGILAGSNQLIGAAQGQGQLEAQAGQGINQVGSTVLGANEAQDWLASQAAFGMANLGNEAENTSLAGANAELGVGGLEQQEAQEQLNVPYENFLAQQAYPFQTTQFQAGIDEGLGSAAGGTSSTTSPGPSAISQAAGFGLAGAGIAAEAGAFNGLGSGIADAAGGLTAGTTAAETAGLIDSGALDAGVGLGGAAAADGAIDAGSFLLAADGGAVPHRAPGGGIAGFPIHKTRMPGTGIAGGMMNDNHPPQMLNPMRMAAGGTTINIPQMPTGGNAAPGITGGNGVHIPQLPTGGGGAMAGGPGIGAVNSYLANNPAPPPPRPAAAAPMAAPSAGISGPAPAPAAAPSSPAAAAAAPSAPPALGPTSIGPSGVPLSPAQPMQFGVPMTDLQEASQMQASFGGPGNWNGPGAGGGGGGGGNARGGIVRRDDGGSLPPGDPEGFDDMNIRDVEGQAGIMPNVTVRPPHHAAAGIGGGPNIKIGPENSTNNPADWKDFRDSQPQPGAAAPPAPAMGPVNVGTGSAPPPPSPGITRASYQAPPMGPEGPGNGIAGPPPGPPQDAMADQTAAQPQQPDAREPQHPHNWAETLIAAGLGIMGGTSPHAAVNIGRGGLQGLQFGENQRAREAQEDLRSIAQQQLGQYRQQMGNVAQQKADNSDQRTVIYGQKVTDQASFNAAKALHMQNGDTEKVANDKAMQQYHQDTINLGLAKAMTSADQGNQRIDQGNQRLAQGDQRLQIAQQAQQLRSQMFSATQDQNERKLINSANNSDMVQAGRIMSSAAAAGTPVPPFSKALEMVHGQRATLPSTAPTQQQQPVAAAAPADPLSQARAAIAKGASRDAVVQRLQQAGIDPTGL